MKGNPSMPSLNLPSPKIFSEFTHLKFPTNSYAEYGISLFSAASEQAKKYPHYFFRGMLLEPQLFLVPKQTLQQHTLNQDNNRYAYNLLDYITCLINNLAKLRLF